MKILHIISGLSTGGAELMLYKLLSVIDRSSYKPVVISLTNEGHLGNHLEKLGIPVHIIKMAAGFPNPFKITRLINLVKKINPDLVQGWMYHGNMAALMAIRFLPKRVSLFWNIRHTPNDLKEEKLMTGMIIRLGAYFSSLPNGIIYNSKVSAQKHKSMGYSERNEKIIPNGFDCERFKPSDTAKEKLLRILNIREEVFLIGLIARYHKMKDHKTFIYSARELIQTYPKVHFVLVGSGINEKNKDLTKQIKDLKIGRNVHLLGERWEIYRITSGLDIACSSSSWGESFSNVIGEAMACGVPCVVTRVGDSAEIVGETGLVVDPGEKDAFVDALQKMIEMSPDKRRELGRLARQRIIKHFTLDTVVKQYEQAYKEQISAIKH